MPGRQQGNGCVNSFYTRDFFSSSRMAENVFSFQEMSNYNELLQIAQNLLNNETEPNFEDNNSEIIAGKYFAKVKFKNRSDREVEMGSVDDSTFRFRAYKDTTGVELEKGIRGNIVSLGLHNFGMDVNRERYPIGQKIEFTIYDESGNEAVNSFCTLNGSGHLVQKNRDVFQKEWLGELDKIKK